ncbi:F0F1 ATP synthase subunit gamma [Allostreptomyces psammosilenae]|uniref:ATP synthase gamma chain n=1 Tax=Allostreptomyces psammosilenae TaxID=1892865 RepID=A0A852ZYX3_9ACTN|nr:F0F1 ATP synthase subunit gamma [Allostreptomyces psammosilenae]NYI06430.1 F-type H+-transporting ATPase subunit gamma [Allostreptomyces psammosilenae]
MGAQLRVYKRKIRSVSAIKKTTRAMEMISSSRIVKAQRAVQASTPYATELTRAVAAVASGSSADHPLTTENPNARRAAVLLITSDRGQAGGYNSNAIKRADALAARLRGEGKEVSTYIVGRKGVGFYTFRDRSIEESWTGFSDKPTYADAKSVAGALLEAFAKDEADGGVDELHVVYTEFVSMLTQNPVDSRLLPLTLDKPNHLDMDAEAIASGKDPHALYEFEPSPEGVLDALLPRYVESRVYNALLQSAASEHAARRRAMKSATDNAEELIKSYTRLANAARQADITQEISEIVGGADALADATAGSD